MTSEFPEAGFVPASSFYDIATGERDPHPAVRELESQRREGSQ